MFKNKAFVMVAILVLVLATVAISCAPAAKPATTTAPAATTPPATTTAPATTPAAPPPTPPVPSTATPPPAAAPAAPVIKTSFEATTYTDTKNGYSVMYPKSWTTGDFSKIPGAVFLAASGKDDIIIGVRPATSFKDASVAFVTDIITASGQSFTPSVDAENNVTLADGTKADQVLVSAAFGMAKGASTGIIKNGNAIMIVTLSDPGKWTCIKRLD